MNKKKSSLSQVALATGVAVLSLMLLSGCKSVEETAEGIASDMKSTVNSAAQAIAHAVGDGKGLNLPGDDSGSLILETSSAVGQLNGILIDHQVGNIEIEASPDDQIQVSAQVYHLNANWGSKDSEQVFEQAAVSIQTEGTQARIRLHAKDDPENSLWDWAQSKHKYTEFGVNYKIALPTDINTFKIANNVGNIKLTGLTGEFLLNNEVGNVDLVSAGITGPSEIGVSTGNVELELQSFENKGNLDVNVALGNIHATLADAVKGRVNPKIKLGDVSDSSAKSRTGKDGSISLAVDVGNVDIY